MNSESVAEKKCAVEDELVLRGWKKDSYLYYKYADKTENCIISIILDENVDKYSCMNITALIRLHNTKLNEFSNFIEQFNCGDPKDIGIFEGFPIPLRLHLRGFLSLNLSAIDRVLNCGASGGAQFAKRCDAEARRIYDKYKYVEDICMIYDRGRRISSRDSIVINLFLKKYRKIRDIFEGKISHNDKIVGYIIRYMDRYDLI